MASLALITAGWSAASFMVKSPRCWSGAPPNDGPHKMTLCKHHVGWHAERLVRPFPGAGDTGPALMLRSWSRHDAQHPAEANGLVELLLTVLYRYRPVIEPCLPPSGVCSVDMRYDRDAVARLCRRRSLRLSGDGYRCASSSTLAGPNLSFTQPSRPVRIVIDWNHRRDALLAARFALWAVNH